jgi:hypothetical protein
LSAQCDAHREQFVGVTSGVLNEAVSTPFLTRPGIVALTLSLASASTGLDQPAF